MPGRLESLLQSDILRFANHAIIIDPSSTRHVTTVQISPTIETDNVHCERFDAFDENKRALYEYKTIESFRQMENLRLAIEKKNC